MEPARRRGDARTGEAVNIGSQTGNRWERAGRVVKMQVAGRRIRNGPRYEPSPLREVSRLRLTAEGIIGYAGGGWLLDSHHRAHPERTRFQPHRVLLIGFEPNYRRLWEEFRPTGLGAAGEALIVSADRFVTPEEAAGGVRITSGGETIELDGPEPAIACAPFTRYVLQRPDLSDEEEKLSAPRRRLSEGLRGYVVPYQRPQPFDVEPGAEVFLRPS